MKALEKLRAAGLVHKSRTLDSLREKPVKRGQGWIMLTFDPGVIQSQPEKREIIDWDVRLAHRLMTTGTLEPQVGDYQWVSSYASMILEIEAMYVKTGKPVKVAFDTETMGLYPWYPDKDFVCCSFTHKPGCSQLLYLGPQSAPIALDPSQPLFDQIKWLLTSPKVRLRMANGKYDLIWVKEKWGIDCTNFTFDTLLAGSLVDENRTNSPEPARQADDRTWRLRRPVQRQARQGAHGEGAGRGHARLRRRRHRRLLPGGRRAAGSAQRGPGAASAST